MQKWDVIHVYCNFLLNPHFKYCICICPNRRWFFFINSDPPQFRKARKKAISISRFEAHFLNHESFIDITSIEELDEALIDAALKDESNHMGPLMPSLVEGIQYAVAADDSLEPDKAQAVAS